MSGGGLAPSLEDGALPQLSTAIDSEAMLPRIAGALGVRTEGAHCAVEVLSHKPGDRATLLYTVEGSSGMRRAVGKLYRLRANAISAHERHRSLREVLAEPDAVPEALALHEDLGMFLQAHIDAPDVRHALADGSGKRPVELAATFLARLHATAAPKGLKTLTAEESLSKVAARERRIVGALPEQKEGLTQTVAALRACAPSTLYQRLIHKDLYYAHVLWDGERIAVIDFDQLHQGDPAFDVAHFLAHLANLAYRQTGNPQAYEPEGEAFLAGYEAAASEAVRDRLPFYQAYTFVKLAATDVSRTRGDWRTRAAKLCDLAAQALA